ncbi:M4 family metallopeptidase [Actinoplanes derwentensis]|uniref:Zn-dependent metalloprotease n=1 Tax=Actinoplanes derwentensis TaxID=113562 RepID=A0A1H2CWR1_9ACTN|nr:M4 family metallopeptidase [Actinoplanes derwentensis]GID87909.1 zinc metalloprotease [Actinoplanes derwentensis]SDT74990.1 Zn-dependent metalloprotease [Actinoplanes derwentensis]
MKSRTPVVIALAAATAAASAMVAVAGPATAIPSDPAALAARASDSASALVAGRPPVLQSSDGEAFVQRQVITTDKLQYVPYDRTYKGLPVIGGDFVVVTDQSGQTQYTSVAQTRPIGDLSVTPKLSAADSVPFAKAELKTVKNVESTRLVVVNSESAPALAWESTVNGTKVNDHGEDQVSRLTVDVDATSGAVLRTKEHVTEVTGTGTGWIVGSVSLDTTLSSSTYSLKDPSIATLTCQDASTNTTFSGTDNAWGTGVGTNKETGCVDAFYAAQKQKAMLSSWLGRTGFTSSGGAWPIRVGLNEVNAYYDGTQVQIGKNNAGQWISSLDVVGHEIGHGIDDNTPGGISGNGTQEFVGDVFGAATEAYAANASDPADYQVGEEVNLVGSGPIRYMYNPSLAGDDNCYSSSTPSQEVHAAAGPGNHWFYLLAEGTAPTNGQPASTRCSGSGAITGVGIQTATKIMYNAMLMKTSSSSYLKYRTWTLTSAKALDSTCALFNTTKAAWDAVSVPAQTADPTCTGSTTSPTASPTTSTTSAPAGCAGTNATDVSIPDAGVAVYSDIAISGCARSASSTSTIAVNVVHTYRGDVKLDLVAPDGTVYALKATSTSDSTDNVVATYTANLSSEAANGTWRLKAQDLYSSDTGYINTWTLTV